MMLVDLLLLFPRLLPARPSHGVLEIPKIFFSSILVLSPSSRFPPEVFVVLFPSRLHGLGTPSPPVLPDLVTSLFHYPTYGHVRHLASLLASHSWSFWLILV